MIDSKRKMLIVIGTFILVLLLGTITYAFFNYTRTGGINAIRVGRISFVSKNEQTITLNNLFPIDPTETGIMDDATKVGTYEIEIKGDTDYVDGIEYLISTTDTSITANGKALPISLNVEVTNLGTPNDNYFTAREGKNATIYKKLVGGTLVGDQMLLVGYIKKNTTSGQAEGVDGKITIKAYVDQNKILISDTYDGTESDNMGTPKSLAQGKTVFTTTEWNSLQNTQASFKVKVEANEGIWVNDTLDNIIRTKNLNTTTNQPIMDNAQSEFVTASTGIDFGAVSSDTNGKGIYMRAGTENDAYPIMYYRGAVEDNNVIFNNKCWKAVRTTDTGGVKLIYNGDSVANKAPLDEDDYVLMTNTDNVFEFNSNDKEYVAYVLNGVYEISFKVPAGDNYVFVLSRDLGEGSGGSNFNVYKDSISLGNYGSGFGDVYYKQIEFGNLTDQNVVMFQFSGGGYTTSTEIKIKMLRSDSTLGFGCDNVGTDTHMNISGSNNFPFNVGSHIGYMYGTVYSYSALNWTSGAKFGSGFTWDGTNYKLTDATVNEPNATHHYSCNSTDVDATCTDLRYVYLVSASEKYYITLTGGDGIEQALEKMHTNTTDSTAKTQIDSWYGSNMNTVTSKLEDTIWCNDRSMGNGNNNGWIANGGDLKTYLYYGATERSNFASNTSTVKNEPSLVCLNKNDAFTVSNGNGNQKLTYPIALLTEDEMVLAGGLAGSSSTFYLNNGSTYYWSLSPYSFDYTSASEFIVYSGYINYDRVNVAYGLRPSVSLKPGTPVVRGEGTVTDPYVIG